MAKQQKAGQIWENKLIYSTHESVQGSVILQQMGNCNHAEGRDPKKNFAS